MLSDDELSAIAERVCHERAGQVIHRKLHVETRSRGSGYDATRLREVFSQRMAVYQKFGTLQVITDENGAVVGYIDSDKYLPHGQIDLTREEIVALVADEEVLPAGTAIVAVATETGALGGRIHRVRVKLRRPAKGHDELDVEINPARRAIAAVKPIARGKP
jgi:hypothetical protein